jgi:hypothetical protein
LRSIGASPLEQAEQPLVHNATSERSRQQQEDTLHKDLEAVLVKAVLDAQSYPRRAKHHARRQSQRNDRERQVLKQPAGTLPVPAPCGCPRLLHDALLEITALKAELSESKQTRGRVACVLFTQAKLGGFHARVSASAAASWRWVFAKYSDFAEFCSAEVKPRIAELWQWVWARCEEFAEFCSTGLKPRAAACRQRARAKADCIFGDCVAGHGIAWSPRPDGSRYDGEWNKDGYMHGTGIHTWADGRVAYVGEWKNGNKHGRGNCSFADGSRYEGEWKSGSQHGQGARIYPDGARYEGEWLNGRALESKCVYTGAPCGIAALDNTVLASDFARLSSKMSLKNRKHLGEWCAVFGLLCTQDATGKWQGFCTPKVLRQAHRQLALKYHPDKFGGQKRCYLMVNAGKELLGNLCTQ